MQSFSFDALDFDIKDITSWIQVISFVEQNRYTNY